MPQKFKSEVQLEALNNATVDTDRFLVSDSGIVKYRTGSEVLSDIGAQSALVNPVTGTGTTNFLSKFTGATSLGNSQIFDNGTFVGIGTAIPGVKLDVIGSSRFSGFDSGYYNENVLAIGNGTNNPKIGLASISGYRWNTRIRDVGGNGEYVIRYEEGSLDALVLNRSGNLGLGVTPSAWDTGNNVEAFQFGPRAALWNFSTNNVFLGLNYYWNGTNRIYIGSTAATEYQQITGEHRWLSAPSGTAGNAISFTQAMTLGSNSGLSIGTTTAAAANGLRVEGAATFLNSVTAGGNIQSNRALVATGPNADWTGLGIFADIEGTFGRLGVYNYSTLSWGALSINNGSIYSSGNNGDVGIGTTNPSSRLEVSGDIKTNGAITLRALLDNIESLDIRPIASTANFIITNYRGAGTSSIQFNSNGNTLINQSGGNVGIGTTDPQSLLHLYSSSNTTHLIQDAGSILRFINAGGINYIQSGLTLTGGSAAPLVFGTIFGNNEWMRITSTGDIGIGTTNPSSLLHLNGSGYFPSKLITLSGAEPTRYSANIGTLIVDGSKIGLALGTRSDNVNYDNSLVVVNGNVGIGTTSPSDRFHVYSNVADVGLQVQNNTHSSFLRSDATGTQIATNSTTKPIYFYVGAAERLRITPAGDVGIGTQSPQSLLHLKQSDDTFLNGIKLEKGTGTNTYSAVVGGDNSLYLGYGTTPSASPNNLLTITSGGQVNIGGNYTSTTNTLQVTGNAAIGYTNAAPSNGLIVAGNVGIGTTSPSAKLHINNNSWGTSNQTVDKLIQRYIGFAGDFRQHVILLHPMYDSTNINLNLCIGTIYASRGSSAAGLIGDTYHVDTYSAFTSNRGHLKGVFGEGKLFTCYYNGVKYLALLPQFRTSAVQYNFEGYSKTTGEQLLLVEYRISNTGVIINSEIFNSLQEFSYFVPTFNKGLFVTSPNNIGSSAILTQGGSVALPSYSFIGDTNTGMYNIAADTLGFATNGGERMRITSAGNVGIGTTNPNAKLEVNGVIKSNNDIISTNGTISSILAYSSTYGAVFGSATNHNANIYTNSLPRVTVTTAGDVGIGTTNPQRPLDVITAIRISGTTPVLDLGNDFDNQIWANSTTLNIKAGGTERITINKSTGDVGIGTDTPNAKLEVSADSLINGLTIGRGGGSTSTNTAIGFQALLSSTSGADNNTALGFQALKANQGGDDNTAIGNQALIATTTTKGNTAVGSLSLQGNTGGSANTAIGVASLQSNTIGSNNIGIGGSAGKFIANGTTANTSGTDSIFLGVGTKASADNQTNQIVIGHNATGLGSNTVVLGNNSIVTTALKGSVGVGTTVIDASAILELRSTTKGFLPPVMNTTDRDNISSPANGLMIFNTDTEEVNVFTSTNGWRAIPFQ